MKHIIIKIAPVLLFCLKIQAKYCVLDTNLDNLTVLRIYEKTCSDKGRYSDTDRHGHQSNVLKNLKRARIHNERLKQGKETFKLGLNKFSDKSDDELKSILGLIIDPQETNLKVKRQLYPIQKINPGGNFDLRSTGCIRDVGNQEFCASCYAWAAAYVADACRCLQCGTKLDASSIQDIVDCSYNFGNYGCDGGNIKNAVSFTSYYASAKHVDYPYKGIAGNCVRPSSSIVNQNLLQHIQLPKLNETAMLEMVKEKPLAVGIKGNLPELASYAGGIISGKLCYAVESELDHAVLVIGYGIDYITGKPYWLCQNFWDKDWGENGLFRLEMGTNCLGIAFMPSYVRFGC